MKQGAARPFTENQMLGVAAKKAIAREAAALVQDGDDATASPTTGTGTGT